MKKSEHGYPGYLVPNGAREIAEDVLSRINKALGLPQTETLASQTKLITSVGTEV